MSCDRIQRLALDALAGRASEAERLELEAHLETCQRCQEARVGLSAVRALRQWEPDPLSDIARARVREAALSAARPAAAPTGHGVPRWGWALAVASILLVFGGLWKLGGRRAPGTEEMRVHSDEGGTFHLGPAEVLLLPHTTIVYKPALETLALEEGQVEVEVEPGRGHHFRVSTRRFLVEVLGTRFTVNADEVRTARGTVRVLSPTGEERAVLHAGERWTVSAAATSEPAPVSPTLPPPATTPAPTTPAPSAHPSHAVTTHPRRGADEAGDPLAAARRALARGDAEGARVLLRPLFSEDRRLAVEARALMAESYLVEGRYDDAVSGYQIVVRDFRRTPQAESALYAIGQIQLESGRRVDARQTFSLYLSRYPEGRFAREVRERMERLGGADSAP